MIEYLSNIVDALNKITPLGMAAGLSFIIYSIVGKKGRVRLISDNHLSGLPTLEANIAALVDSGKRQEAKLDQIVTGVAELKGAINARS